MNFHMNPAKKLPNIFEKNEKMKKMKKLPYPFQASLSLNVKNSVRGEAQVEQFCSWRSSGRAILFVGGLSRRFKKFKKKQKKNKKCQNEKSSGGQVD